MPTDKMRDGAAAEALAADFLTAHGLRVLGRNLRSRGGELDLVCLDGAVLVIVEVRSRSRVDYGGAAASVTRCKQRKLLRAARYEWQRRAEWRDRLVRFDVVGIQVDGRGTDATRQIEWIRDAFRAG